MIFRRRFQTRSRNHLLTPLRCGRETPRDFTVMYNASCVPRTNNFLKKVRCCTAVCGVRSLYVECGGAGGACVLYVWFIDSNLTRTHYRSPTL